LKKKKIFLKKLFSIESGSGRVRVGVRVRVWAEHGDVDEVDKVDEVEVDVDEVGKVDNVAGVDANANA
jgi:hypothetical protein